jgi:hypothetical protein
VRALLLSLTLSSIAISAIAAQEEGGSPEISAAKEAIIDMLKDPDSAKFTGVFVSPKFNWIVCGSVNGKNEYGGYAGPRRFIVFLDKQNSSPPNVNMEPSSVGKDWPDYCMSEEATADKRMTR